MLFMTITMKVGPEKRMELAQAITSLMGSMRTDKGCQGCNLYQSLEDENELYLLGEWESREALDSHLQSKDFKVLLGAMYLLRRPHEMRLYEVVGCLENDGDVTATGGCSVKQATG